MIDMLLASKKATSAMTVVVVMTGRRHVVSSCRHRHRHRPFLFPSLFLQRPPPLSSFVSALPSSCTSMIHGQPQMPKASIMRKPSSLYTSFSFSTATTAASRTTTTTTTTTHLRTPFLLADIGEGIKEVELLTWFVKTGDHVHQFDKICEVQSDKATVEITSRYDGYVDELAGNVGDMVQVGQPLLYLVTNNNTSHGSSGGGGSGGGSSTLSAEDASISTNSSSSSTVATTEAAATTTTMTPFQDTMKTLELDERLRIPSVASHYHLKSDDDDDNDNESGSSSSSSSSSSKFSASPAVRKLGKEYKLDLSIIHGSGPRGRLLKTDVLVYLQEQGRRMPSPLTTTITTTPVVSESQSSSSSSVQSQPGQQQQPPQQQQQQVGRDLRSSEQDIVVAACADADADEYEIVQLKGYNRLMVQSMTKALKIPHMGFGDEIIVDNLMKCRNDLNNNNNNNNDNHNNNSKLSLMAFLCKACSLALTEFPLLNAASVVMKDDGADPETSSSSTAANTLHVYKEHRLGIAMDTPRGLVVPVIRHVQQKSILQIQDDLNRFKELAANSKLSSTELSISPTFTLSNIGALGCGGMTLQPVIVPPQVAMGAMGRIQKVPRYVDDDDDSADSSSSMNHVLQPVHVMHVTWAGDHRYLDGATLARFHHRFSYYLQHPTRMLLHLK